MDAPNTRRIVLLGKTGNGKSSLANTIFGETVFKVNQFNESEKCVSQAETRCVNGRSLTLIDTPGFFDPGKSERDMKPEMMRWTAECAPGPHVFLIVLQVEKFTEQEQSVINRICQHFSDDALKYAAVVFTHGDQLPDQMKIKEYIGQSQGLSDLVEKCGGRCHVFDNKYWKDNQQDDYRNNQSHVAELLNTIDTIVMENAGGHYTNAELQEMESEIQKQEESIKQSSSNLPQEEIRKQAISNILREQAGSGAEIWKKCFRGLAVLTGLSVAAAAVWISSQKVALPGSEVVGPLIEKAVTVPLVVEPLIEKVVTVPLVVEPVIEKAIMVPLAVEAVIEKAITVPLQVAEEQIAEIAAALPAIAVEQVAVATEEGMQNIAETILNYLNIYETIYNPFNPFD